MERMENTSSITVTKRKTDEELRKVKRSAMGDITNVSQESRMDEGKDLSVDVPQYSKDYMYLEDDRDNSTSTVQNITHNLGNSSSSHDISEEMIVDTIRISTRPTPPDYIEDFDLEIMGDPQQHSEYAMETFQYYKNREAVFRVPNYMDTQPSINEAMRSIVVNWLCEFQENFRLKHETLYAAVKMTDLYCSRTEVKKQVYQLVATTACMIACKFDERKPRPLEDFLDVCDGAYTLDQILRMERKMLFVLGCDLGFPLSYKFLRRYGRVCGVTMPVLTLARYILELSLLEYSFNVEVRESELAAAALILALKIENIEGWAPTLKYYTGLNFIRVDVILQQFLQMLQREHRSYQCTVKLKYSHKRFFEVVHTPIPAYVTLTADG